MKTQRHSRHQVKTAVLFEQLRGKILEIKIFVEMRCQAGTTQHTLRYQISIVLSPRISSPAVWEIERYLHCTPQSGGYKAPHWQLTIIFILAAGGWGPGLPRLSWPRAILARYLLWTSRIVAISASLTPRDNGWPLQAGPEPCIIISQFVFQHGSNIFSS